MVLLHSKSEDVASARGDHQSFVSYCQAPQEKRRRHPPRGEVPATGVTAAVAPDVVRTSAERPAVKLRDESRSPQELRFGHFY